MVTRAFRQLVVVAVSARPAGGRPSLARRPALARPLGRRGERHARRRLEPRLDLSGGEDGPAEALAAVLHALAQEVVPARGAGRAAGGGAADWGLREGVADRTARLA